MGSALVIWTAGLAAQEVYRSVGEDGVVTFSDQATAGAERVMLPGVSELSESARAEQQALIEQQLEVAEALETSRLAREEARTRRLEALAAASAAPVSYPEPEPYRYASGVVSYHGYAGYRHRFGHGPHHPAYGKQPGVLPGHPPNPQPRMAKSRHRPAARAGRKVRLAPP